MKHEGVVGVLEAAEGYALVITVHNKVCGLSVAVSISNSKRETEA